MLAVGRGVPSSHENVEVTLPMPPLLPPPLSVESEIRFAPFL